MSISTHSDRETLAPVAPRLSKEALFGGIWAQPELPCRERSLSTLVTAAPGRVEQLLWHIRFAGQNGVSRAGITELITHLAFCAGWPAAVLALNCLEQEEQ